MAVAEGNSRVDDASFVLMAKRPPLAPYAEAMSHGEPGTTTRSSGPSCPQTNRISPIGFTGGRLRAYLRGDAKRHRHDAERDDARTRNRDHRVPPKESDGYRLYRDPDDSARSGLSRVT